MALARVQIVQGEAQKALATLDRWRSQAQAAGRVAHVVENYLLQALAWQAQGDADAALESLQQSLALAEPEGYTRLFLEAGAPLVGLLHQAAAQGVAPGYVEWLLAASDAPAAPPRPPAQALVEPLTIRELELLQLICEGLSNQEIAARLVITLNTVKKHSSNVYSKLGVNSRAQAIVRARELDLC